MRIKDAIALVGGIGKPSKMPGFAYGIPAQACKTGGKLSRVPGSVCAKCYAKKGRYVFANVAQAQARRLASIYRKGWVQAIALILIRRNTRWFRWHDSGDIQSMRHLRNIVSVARMVPECRFWIPTKEVGLVREYLRKHGAFPENLVVRVSGAMIGGTAPDFPQVSVVRFAKDAARAGEWVCPAPTQGGKCGECRACWNPDIKSVSYKQH